ncbi:protein of unknown function [Agreia sp. COWG]|nr:protein of unknown function [Agreia sp. COWG]
MAVQPEVGAVLAEARLRAQPDHLARDGTRLDEPGRAVHRDGADRPRGGLVEAAALTSLRFSGQPALLQRCGLSGTVSTAASVSLASEPGRESV